MCRLNRQHILLWMTNILLNGGSCCDDSNSRTPITANNTPTNAMENENCLTKELTLFILIGLPVMGFLLLLSLTCQCISCIYIMSRKAEPTVIASPKEDKEQTIVAGEEELWYTTVKFNKEAKNPDQMTNFDQKSEYATVVIKTPDRRSLQLDLADEAEESNEICID